MDVGVRFKWNKERIIDSFRGRRNCRIIFTNVDNAYMLLNSHFDDFSYIRFPVDNLTIPITVINYRQFKYFGQFKLPSISVAKKIILNMYNVKECNEYISIFETIVNREPLFECVTENVEEHKDSEKLEKLEKIIYRDDNIRLEYEVLIKNDLTKYLIFTSSIPKAIVLEVEKNMEKVERLEIGLGSARKIYNATSRYMFDIGSIRQYKYFEKFIRTLYELILVKKYNEEKAIKELVKKHGYRDVFLGYI